MGVEGVFSGYYPLNKNNPSMNVVEAATQTEPTNSKTQGTRTQTDKVQDKRPLQKETALNVDVQPTTTQERPNKISEYIKNNNIEELYK